jgi:hypothetical protein
MDRDKYVQQLLEQMRVRMEVRGLRPVTMAVYARPQCVHFARIKPCAKIPHRKNASTSAITNAGSTGGSAADSSSERNVFQWAWTVL